MQAVDTQTFSEKDKILFYKQLVYMLKGGVSILQAVDTLKRTTNNYALKKVTTSIIFYLNEGKSFSYALSRLPEYFEHLMLFFRNLQTNIPILVLSKIDINQPWLIRSFWLLWHLVLWYSCFQAFSLLFWRWWQEINSFHRLPWFSSQFQIFLSDIGERLSFVWLQVWLFWWFMRVQKSEKTDSQKYW